MIYERALRQCLDGRVTHLGVVGLALAALLGLACGVQAQGSLPGGSGGLRRVPGGWRTG